MTCANCGCSFNSTSHNQTYCGSKCRNHARYLRRAPVSQRPYDAECVWCGRPARKAVTGGKSKRAPSPVCSTGCRGAWQSYLQGYVQCAWKPRPERPVKRDPEPRKCVECGIVVEKFQYRCEEHRKARAKAKKSEYRKSDKYIVVRRDEKKRRRARKRTATVEKFTSTSIYVRDGWKCHLCGKSVKRDAKAPYPLAPTLDHIVPLSKNGTHERSNVACAHFICNSRKGDRAANDQLLLFG